MSKSTIARKQLRELQVTDASGLNVGIAAGNVLIGTTLVTYTGTASFALTDNATNYVEINSAGTIVNNTTAFISTNFALAKILTATGDITSISDKRSILTQSGGGGGGGGATFESITSTTYTGNTLTQVIVDGTTWDLTFDNTKSRIDSVTNGTNTFTINYNNDGTLNTTTVT